MINTLTVVAKIRAAQGKGDALAAFLTEQAGVVLRAEVGKCLAYRVHRSTKDPGLFLFYEQYVDEAAFEAHRTSEHLAAFRARREKEGLVAGPAEVDVYRAITD
jgi:quinol monooxygenase YgiN